MNRYLEHDKELDNYFKKVFKEDRYEAFYLANKERMNQIFKEVSSTIKSSIDGITKPIVVPRFKALDNIKLISDELLKGFNISISNNVFDEVNKISFVNESIIKSLQPQIKIITEKWVELSKIKFIKYSVNNSTNIPNLIIEDSVNSINSSNMNSNIFKSDELNEEEIQEAQDIINNIFSDSDDKNTEQKIYSTYLQFKEKHPIICVIIIFLIQTIIQSIIQYPINNFLDSNGNNSKK